MFVERSISWVGWMLLKKRIRGLCFGPFTLFVVGGYLQHNSIAFGEADRCVLCSQKRMLWKSWWQFLRSRLVRSFLDGLARYGCNTVCVYFLLLVVLLL